MILQRVTSATSNERILQVARDFTTSNEPMNFNEERATSETLRLKEAHTLESKSVAPKSNK